MYHDVSIRGKGTSGDSTGNPQAEVLASAGSENCETREDGVVMLQMAIVWYVPSDGSAEYGISYGHDIEIKLEETSLTAVLRRMKLEGWELMKYGQAMVMGEVCLDFYFQSPEPIYTLHDSLRDLES